MVDHTSKICDHSFEARKATADNPYHFVDSGLPNVYLSGIRYSVCSKCRYQFADIPEIKQLMELIARTLIERPAKLAGQEIRFLRKRVGKSSGDFARMIGVSPEQVSRWENGHNFPEISADKLIRVTYIILSGDPKLGSILTKHLSAWLTSLPGEGREPFIRAKLSRDTWVEMDRAA
jgi:putative zinc finger/helix-turn-helix YgiT family protein